MLRYGSEICIYFLALLLALWNLAAFLPHRGHCSLRSQSNPIQILITCPFSPWNPTFTLSHSHTCTPPLAPLLSLHLFSKSFHSFIKTTFRSLAICSTFRPSWSKNPFLYSVITPPELSQQQEQRTQNNNHAQDLRRSLTLLNIPKLQFWAHTLTHYGKVEQ